MSENVKISTNKVVRFATGAVLVLLFFVLLFATSFKQQQRTISGLEVHLNDDKEFSFLQKNDIQKLLLQNRHIDLANTTLEQLDLKAMEAIALTHPWVANADIYVDNKAILQVNITQREPVARIFDTKGNSYYIDSAYSIMPLSLGYAHPAPVFTNVPVLGSDSVNKHINQKIAYLSEVIRADSFWSAQVTQVVVQPNQTFALHTLLGDQKILLGDTIDVKVKLNHLLAFYLQVSKKIGWDKYQILDARFKDQIVASPSIGWVPPKITDTASVALPPVAKPPQPNNATISKPKGAEVAAKPAVKATLPKSDVGKVAKEVAKPKAVTTKAAAVQTTKVKEEKAKKEEKQKENKSTQSPKYIYPAKKTGNN